MVITFAGALKIGPKPGPKGVKKVRARWARAEMQGSNM